MRSLSKTSTMARQILRWIAAVLLLILVWFAASKIIAAPLILPSPSAVFMRLYAIITTPRFWQNFSLTFLRVIAGFLLSVFLGTVLGLLCADFPALRPFIQLPVSIIRSTPVIAVILVALFWFRSGTVPVFVSLLMTLPVMTSDAEKGFFKSPANQEMLFKAQCVCFSGWSAFRHIRFRAALPFLRSGAQSVFGLSWKVVVAGEVLSLPRFGAGSLLQQAQVHLESADVLALTAILVVVSIILEKLVRIII